jgi:hypothetical protein
VWDQFTKEVAVASTERSEHESDVGKARERIDQRLAANESSSCTLDEEGVKAQQGRHQRLAPSVINLERPPDSVRFTFAEDFDRHALEEMVRVEEECCPFFRFSFEEGERQLTVTVQEREMLPALEAIAAYVGVRWQAEQGVAS